MYSFDEDADKAEMEKVENNLVLLYNLSGWSLFFANTFNKFYSYYIVNYN